MKIHGEIFLREVSGALARKVIIGHYSLNGTLATSL